MHNFDGVNRLSDPLNNVCHQRQYLFLKPLWYLWLALMNGYSSLITANQSGPSNNRDVRQVSLLLKDAVRFIHGLVFFDTLPDIMNTWCEARYTHSVKVVLFLVFSSITFNVFPAPLFLMGPYWHFQLFISPYPYIYHPITQKIIVQTVSLRHPLSHITKPSLTWLDSNANLHDSLSRTSSSKWAYPALWALG